MTSNLEITGFNHLLSYKYFAKNFLLIITICYLNFRIDYLEPISKQVVYENTKLVTCLVLKHTNIHTVRIELGMQIWIKVSFLLTHSLILCHSQFICSLKMP